MKQNMYMLPVRCKGCERAFDLWPILQEQERVSQAAFSENPLARLLKQSFCPNCRKAVLLGMAEQQEELSSEELEESEDDADQAEGAEEVSCEMTFELE